MRRTTRSKSRMFITATIASVATITMVTSCAAAGDPTVGGDGDGTCPATLNTVLTSAPTMTITSAVTSSIPVELGYWDEVGSEIEVGLATSGNLGLVQRFAAGGDIDVAALSGTGALLLAEKGTEVTGILGTIPKNFSQVRVLDSSPIKSVEDLAGKSIGVLSPEASQVPMVNGMLGLEGVDLDSVTFIGVGVGQSALQALIQGKVDALSAWDSAWAPDALWPEEGYRVVMTEAAENMGPSIMASVKPELLELCRDELIEFGKGILKSQIFERENPEAAVRIHWKHYPETKSTGVAEDVALAQNVATLRIRDDMYTEIDGLLGNVTDEMWQDTLEISLAASELTEEIDIAKVWDPSLIEEMNNFDKAAVVEFAKNYTFK